MTSGPTFLGELRDRLLDQVLGLLKADPVIEGVALIGSLGRGEADNCTPLTGGRGQGPSERIGSCRW
jgi:hypothetical protein